MIIRRRHTANFTTIGNVLFNDARLRADELGVLAFLLSRPDDWEVRRPQLAKRFDIGRESIKRIILNCMCTGWIVAKRERLSNGTFHTTYEVRDEPGPTMTPEVVKAALSLVSSEAGETDQDDDVGTDHPPDSGPPDTGQPDTAHQLRQTRSGPIEDSLNPDSVNPESPNGARAFVDVLQVWPPEHVLSTVTSGSAYAALNARSKIDCFSGLKPYLDECKAQSRKVCDLTTFIRERRWERFVNRPAVAQFAIIKPNTPQWFRWREYYIATGHPVATMDDNGRQGKSITTRSEWPPPIPKADEAKSA